ncbi:MAG: hypothetical protein BWY21_02154 [Parcubacteria group bacterium ADurb.Bin216]|nr:MAG: hypothetical protein BWY21_02154 [Parcubacteria group bacterium ADurb.Bin216]
MTQIELIGDRILIQLDKALDHTTTDSGIIIPLNTVMESDSGRLKTTLSEQRHLPAGTITQISKQASSKLEELGVSLVAGDRVYVNPQTLSSSYHWKTDRTKLITEFQGVVCVPHILIEAKIV